MRKLMLLLGVIGMVALAGRSYAGEMEILVQKLVDKGILTQGEGAQVLAETKEEARKEGVGRNGGPWTRGAATDRLRNFAAG